MPFSAKCALWGTLSPSPLGTACPRSRLRTPSAWRASRRLTECRVESENSSVARLRVRVCTTAGCAHLVLDKDDTVRVMLLRGGVPCEEDGRVGAFVNGVWRLLYGTSTLAGERIEDNAVVSVISETGRRASSLSRFWDRHGGAVVIAACLLAACVILAAAVVSLAAAIGAVAQSPLLSLHPPSVGATAAPASHSLLAALKQQKLMLPVIGVAAAWHGVALSSPLARVTVSIAGLLVRPSLSGDASAPCPA